MLHHRTPLGDGLGAPGTRESAARFRTDGSRTAHRPANQSPAEARERESFWVGIRRPSRSGGIENAARIVAFGQERAGSRTPLAESLCRPADKRKRRELRLSALRVNRLVGQFRDQKNSSVRPIVFKSSLYSCVQWQAGRAAQVAQLAWRPVLIVYACSVSPRHPTPGGHRPLGSIHACYRSIRAGC
jgi:hypothetical protein